MLEREREVSAYSGFLNKRLQLEQKREQEACCDIIISAPLKLMLEVTKVCNHRCIFCANSKMTRPRGMIDMALAERLLSEAAEIGVKELSLVATGEPFAFPKITDVIRIAKRLGYTYVYVTTNGGIASPEKLKSALDAGLDSIKFSFNAGTRETYRKIHGQDDFDKVVQRIKYVVDYRRKTQKSFPIGISFVVCDINRSEKKIIENMFGELVDDIVFHEMGAQGGHNNLLVEPIKNCARPFTIAGITYEGYLTLCCVDFQNYLAVADLNRLSLADAWNCETMQNIRKRFLTHDLKGTLCYRCLTGQIETVLPLIPSLATINKELFTDKKTA
ncbi:MAG: radical SAM protein [Planctomycetaceae bacterium]|jgi:organic radical activating enzyme|nr:radical SAM protein [Planctomycetaceae bacterium]